MDAFNNDHIKLYVADHATYEVHIQYVIHDVEKNREIIPEAIEYSPINNILNCLATACVRKIYVNNLKYTKDARICLSGKDSVAISKIVREVDRIGFSGSLVDIFKKLGYPTHSIRSTDGKIVQH